MSDDEANPYEITEDNVHVLRAMLIEERMQHRHLKGVVAKMKQADVDAAGKPLRDRLETVTRALGDSVAAERKAQARVDEVAGRFCGFHLREFEWARAWYRILDGPNWREWLAEGTEPWEPGEDCEHGNPGEDR